MRESMALNLLVLAGVLAWFPFRSGPPPERIGIPMEGKVNKSESEWRAQLTPEQYRVTREKGTERAFTGEFWDCKKPGIYQCVCCGQELFDAEAKYDSCTGWPSFVRPVAEDNVSLLPDNAWFMSRTEVVCSRCGAHLGHVFGDGPAPTGQRFCINSVSLKMVPKEP